MGKKRHKRGLRRRKPIKIALLAKDPNCFYCRKNLTMITGTLDHYIPKSKGGGHDVDNIRLACFECNQKKGNKLPKPKL